MSGDTLERFPAQLCVIVAFNSSEENMTISAFSSHSTFLCASGRRTQGLCSQRQITTTKRRPRRAANVHAVFIWSSEGPFEDEDKRDGDSDADADSNEHDLTDDHQELAENDFSSKYEHPVFGRSWRKKHDPFDDIRGRSTDPHADEFSPAIDMAAQPGVHGNKIYAALRSYSSGPDDIDRIRAMTTDDAADAFRRVVTGIFGSIPGDAFEIVINTDRNGVSRLMQSSLATGYALRNAEFRMMLNDRMSPSFSDRSSGTSRDTFRQKDFSTSGMPDLFASEPDYMRGVPKRGRADFSSVNGSVKWWDAERGAESEMSASDYVAKLEAENELLRERLDASKLHDANSNKLLDYMRTLSPEKIASLQANLSADALDAFKRTVKSVLGELSPSKVQMTYSTSRDYLGHLAFWCLLIGYHARNLEKRLEMARMLEVAESLSGTQND